MTVIYILMIPQYLNNNLTWLRNYVCRRSIVSRRTMVRNYVRRDVDIRTEWVSESLTNKVPGAGVQTSFVHSSKSWVNWFIVARTKNPNPIRFEKCGQPLKARHTFNFTCSFYYDLLVFVALSLLMFSSTWVYLLLVNTRRVPVQRAVERDEIPYPYKVYDTTLHSRA